VSNSIPQIPHKQRALILQGGGALGAYEVGVFKAIYDKIIQEEGDGAAGNLFDIVAGASIGAINATVLVNYFLNNDGWKDSPDGLERFWIELTAKTWVGTLLNNAFIEKGWDVMRFLSNNYVSSFESLRRYLSVQELAYIPFMGSPNLSWTMPIYGNKFLNPLELFSLRYDFSPLKDILKKYINNFPIQTSFDNGEPRLLLVSVDVQDCTTAVTFDSYQNFKPPTVKGNMIGKDTGEADSGQWFSEYGDENNKHIVFHKGIDLDQLLASCLFPFALGHTVMKDEISKTLRTYWDGAFLSNTPLRELIQHHKDFWLSYFDEKGIEYDTRGIERGVDTIADSKYQTGKIKTVPSLEVYIVNLYPSIEKEGGPPLDDDLINDRMNDIRFHDKTKYDEKVAHMTSDYIDMARELLGRMNTARNKIMEQEKTNQIKDSLFAELEKLLDIDKVLEMPAKTISRNAEKRIYRKLLKGRFDVKVCRIDREDDKNTISGKHSDFSTLTIKSLMEKGKEDALRSFQNCRF
jgi:predicted acylesterase/phospholipase RssA